METEKLAERSWERKEEIVPTDRSSRARVAAGQGSSFSRSNGHPVNQAAGYSGVAGFSHPLYLSPSSRSRDRAFRREVGISDLGQKYFFAAQFLFGTAKRVSVQSLRLFRNTKVGFRHHGIPAVPAREMKLARFEGPDVENTKRGFNSIWVLAFLLGL